MYDMYIQLDLFIINNICLQSLFISHIMQFYEKMVRNSSETNSTYTTFSGDVNWKNHSTDLI